MDCSMPGLPVHHQLVEFTQFTSIKSVMPCSHLIVCCPLLLPPIAPSIRVFPVSQLFASGGQSTGISALVSFLPKKSQGWSPSEWTGWISFQSKGLSRVFSNTTVQKHQFFCVQLSYDYWAIKKNEIIPCASTWMDLEMITLSEKSDRKRQMVYHITYMQNL